MLLIILFYGYTGISYAGTTTWVSYRDLAHTVELNTFVDPYRTVYMSGTGYINSQTYHVGYYDGNNVLKLSDGVSTDGSGYLSSQCGFENLGATAGTWHAVVYKDSFASPPSTYVANDKKSVTEDVFTVNASAIPEFPTIIGFMTVMTVCSVIYCWLKSERRRREI